MKVVFVASKNIVINGADIKRYSVGAEYVAMNCFKKKDK